MGTLPHNNLLPNSPIINLFYTWVAQKENQLLLKRQKPFKVDKSFLFLFSEIYFHFEDVMLHVNASDG